MIKSIIEAEKFIPYVYKVKIKNLIDDEILI